MNPQLGRLIVAGLRPLVRFQVPRQRVSSVEQGWTRAHCVPCRYGEGIFYMEGISWTADRH